MPDCESKTFYLAGDLFDGKDLAGNVALAEQIAEISGRRWEALLPQDCESDRERGVSVRDRDLELLFRADAVVANFDGHDLDSGTVMEFAWAKMLDLPAVLLRTDFRKASDQEGDPWNLMCSGYPRSRTLLIPALSLYQQHRAECASRPEAVAAMQRAIAAGVAETLDAVAAETPRLRREEALSTYLWSVRAAGGGLGELLPSAVLAEIIAGKIRRGIL